MLVNTTLLDLYLTGNWIQVRRRRVHFMFTCEAFCHLPPFPCVDGGQARTGQGAGCGFQAATHHAVREDGDTHAAAAHQDLSPSISFTCSSRLTRSRPSMHLRSACKHVHCTVPRFPCVPRAADRKNPHHPTSNHAEAAEASPSLAALDAALAVLACAISKCFKGSERDSGLAGVAWYRE